MHTDFAKPQVRRWIASQRPRLNWKRAWARLRCWQIRFDLWYSECHVSILATDLSLEAAKQADLRRNLAHFTRIAN